jgi:hypothetical protein
MGERIFNPAANLVGRDPQDNGSKSDKIVNPPRYMQMGGLTGKAARGIKQNEFGVKAPGATLSKVPFKHL